LKAIFGNRIGSHTRYKARTAPKGPEPMTPTLNSDSPLPRLKIAHIQFLEYDPILAVFWGRFGRSKIAGFGSLDRSIKKGL